MNLAEIQEQLRDHGVEGWLFFDHHHRDPIAYRVLELDPKLHATRRWYYWIPAAGEPTKLVHRIENWNLDSLPGSKQVYSAWKEQHEKLAALLEGVSRLAMQYSPQCMIPYVSLVDAGTVDLIRSLDKEIVSSAALVQYFEARWSGEQFDSHLQAGRLVDATRREAFQEIGRRIQADGAVQEITIAEFINSRFHQQGIVTDEGPVVAVNANSGNPHYAPSAEQSSPIGKGDFVLIDMWAKLDRPRAVYYDITWAGFAGDRPPDEIQNVFEIVRETRDRAFEFVRTAVAAGRDIAGCDVDDVARRYIGEKGFAEFFTHRTGHSIGEDIHGNGANMDNLETRDERLIIPQTCFSIEPGIYLSQFGVRSEIDCYVSVTEAKATGEVQEELVTIPC